MTEEEIFTDDDSSSSDSNSAGTGSESEDETFVVDDSQNLSCTQVSVLKQIVFNPLPDRYLELSLHE